MSSYYLTMNDGAQEIAIEYWSDERGMIDGIAYFRGIDLESTISDCSFKHPQNGIWYELHTPAKPLKSEYAVLMVTRPTLCDRQIPSTTPPN